MNSLLTTISFYIIINFKLSNLKYIIIYIVLFVVFVIAEENMLKLMFITNSPQIALVAQNAGTDRIFIDMEYIGKEERQKGMNTVKNHHTVSDVKSVRKVLDKSQLLVRINPIHEKSEQEINSVIDAGADIIMLPMWKSVLDVEEFADIVGTRAKKMLLLETKEACNCLEDVLKLECADEIHIGLNDLRISTGKKFIFEPVADGTVENILNIVKPYGVPCGFGGFGMPGEGLLPADLIIAEHYRLGSSMAILSRSFCDLNVFKTEEEIKSRFESGVRKIRDYENFLRLQNAEYFVSKHNETKARVSEIISGDSFV